MGCKVQSKIFEKHGISNEENQKRKRLLCLCQNEGEKMKILMKETYSSLHLIKLKTKEAIEKYGGGYKYLVQDSYARGVIAFHTEKGLLRYLRITGLKMKLTTRGEDTDTYNLVGSYEKISMAGTAKELNDFGRKKKLRGTKILSKGEYTKAWYRNGKIYYLNPNYPREIFPYRTE